MINSANKSSRLLSLDVFRGITIALMILVNSPTNYAWLNHSDWNGCTLADLVFPKTQAAIHISETNGTRENLRVFITNHFFGWISLQNASLLYAIAYVFVWLLVMTIFYRNKIFIKI